MVGATAGPLPPPTHDADAGANAVYQYLTEAEVGRMNHSFNQDPGVVGQMGGPSVGGHLPRSDTDASAHENGVHWGSLGLRGSWGGEVSAR